MDSRNAVPDGGTPRPRVRRRRRGVLAGIVAVLSAIALIAAGCSSDSGATSESSGNGNGGGGGGGTVTIGYLAWDEDIALTNLFTQQLEDAGYDVKMTQLSAGAIFSGMANGDIDMFLDTWLPATHKQYWDKYGDKLEKLGGPWYDDASLDLTVPDYVDDVNSIGDLKDHADEFDGQIIGIDPGAGIMDQVKNHAIPDYDLNGVMELKQSSTPAMLAELGSAIDDQKPVVVTLWHPHWAYSRYDLKDLKDPKKSMGEAEKLFMTARNGFSDDFPDVAEVASNFTIDDDDLQSLEDAIQSAGKGGEADAVEQWTEENQSFVDEKFSAIAND